MKFSKLPASARPVFRNSAMLSFFLAVIKSLAATYDPAASFEAGFTSKSNPNGVWSYVYYISPTQINILTPPDMATGTVQVQAATNAGTSASFAAQAQAQSPSFFIFGGGPYVTATHGDGSLIGPASLYPGLTTPAQPGGTIVLYANGFGPTSTPVVSGSETQSGSLNPLPVVTIGVNPATVQFAGLISPGLFQFNVVVPASTPAGDNALTATYGGSSTQSGVLVTVGP